MGLFDEIVGAVSGSEFGQAHAGVISALTGVLSNAQTGGLSGVVQSFEQAGLGNLVQSWVGTGQNLPVTAEQVTQALSSGQLGAIAAKFGLQDQEVANVVAQVLPQLIDHLTPNGTVPQHEDLVSSLAGIAQGFFRGSST